MTAEQSLDHVWLKRPAKPQHIKDVKSIAKPNTQPVVVPTICKTDTSPPPTPLKAPLTPPPQSSPIESQKCENVIFCLSFFFFLLCNGLRWKIFSMKTESRIVMSRAIEFSSRFSFKMFLFSTRHVVIN